MSLNKFNQRVIYIQAPFCNNSKHKTCLLNAKTNPKNNNNILLDEISKNTGNAIRRGSGVYDNGSVSTIILYAQNETFFLTFSSFCPNCCFRFYFIFVLPHACTKLIQSAVTSYWLQRGLYIAVL